MNNPSEAVATSEGNSEPSSLSILEVLRAPTHTELTRKRKNYHVLYTDFSYAFSN